jgi:hypothetical protein
MGLPVFDKSRGDRIHRLTGAWTSSYSVSRAQSQIFTIGELVRREEPHRPAVAPARCIIREKESEIGTLCFASRDMDPPV